MSGVACFIVALVHLHHLLPCTLFTLNGLVFLSLAHELWDALQHWGDQEASRTPSTV